MVNHCTARWGCRLRLMCGVLLAVALFLPQSAEAQRRRTSRGRGYYAAAAAKARQQAMIKAAQAQRDAAQQVLTAAQAKGFSAQSQLAAAVAKLRESGDEFRSAQSTARQLQKQLHEIEQEIVADQAASSPYAQAVAKLEAARAELTRVEAKLLAEPAIESALGNLVGVELTQRKLALIGDRGEYLIAKNALTAAGSEVERLRRELFRGDSDWTGTAEALTQAHKEEHEAEQKAAAQGPSQLAPSRDLRQSDNAASAARQSLAQAEAVLRRFKGSGKSKSSTNSSSSSSVPAKKKKK